MYGEASPAGAPSMGGPPHGGAPGMHGGAPSGAPDSSGAAPHGGKHDHEYYVSHDPFAMDHSSGASSYNEMNFEDHGFIEPTGDNRNMSQYGSATMQKRVAHQAPASSPPQQF